MTKEELDDVLTILSMVLLINDDSGPTNSESFANAAYNLVINSSAHKDFTPDLASQWFEDNRADMISILKTGDADMKIRRLLWSIDNAPYRNQIFEKMVAIGHSGQAKQDAEHQLIRLAADIWGTPYASTREAVAV